MRQHPHPFPPSIFITPTPRTNTPFQAPAPLAHTYVRICIFATQHPRRTRASDPQPSSPPCAICINPRCTCETQRSTDSRSGNGLPRGLNFGAPMRADSKRTTGVSVQVQLSGDTNGVVGWMGLGAWLWVFQNKICRYLCMYMCVWGREVGGCWGGDFSRGGG